MEHVSLISLTELVAATGGEAVGFERREVDFASVAIDSRTVRPGELFWALRGERHDGHDFAAEARQRGAAACVIEADRAGDCSGPRIIVPNTLEALWNMARWYRGCRNAVVVGVTGSVGKTTTREMIHAVLSSRLNGTRSPRNFNNHIGLPLSVLEIKVDHAFAVLELAASAVGEIGDLAAIAAPQIGVVTAIGPAHWEGFGSRQNIIDAKGELVESLPHSGFAVLAGDDPQVRGLADRAACEVCFVGEGPDNLLRATNVETGKNRLRFQADGQSYEVPVTGRHHLTAALCAIAVGRELGLRAAEINAGLESFVPVSGRCQLREFGSWTVIDDTYNANPMSMQAACELLADYPAAGKKLLVTGDMLELGTRAVECHRDLGTKAAAAEIDRLLVCGEHSQHVIQGALDAGMQTSQLARCDEIKDVCHRLDHWLEPGDAVLVKGSRATRMERVVDWLRDRAQQEFKEKTSRASARVSV